MELTAVDGDGIGKCLEDGFVGSLGIVGIEGVVAWE